MTPFAPFDDADRRRLLLAVRIGLTFADSPYVRATCPPADLALLRFDAVAGDTPVAFVDRVRALLDLVAGLERFFVRPKSPWEAP